MLRGRERPPNQSEFVHELRLFVWGLHATAE